MEEPLAELRDVSVSFGAFQALRSVSLAIAPGEIVAIIGESGSGKTTALRALMGLTPISEGQVMFQGQSIAALKGRERRRIWRDMQMIFQDPAASLAPRRTITASVAEPLLAHGSSREAAAQRAGDLLSQMGLGCDIAQRWPADLSGGQRQRVAIARALALSPRLVVGDEPMSALDVSIKAQIASLFRELRTRTNTALLIVSHDLALMAQIADRLIVMKEGRIVEEGSAAQISRAPQQAYTLGLRDACLDPYRVVHDRFGEGAAGL
jgi:ABC-type glutathione transport system ATPase component